MPMAYSYSWFRVYTGTVNDKNGHALPEMLASLSGVSCPCGWLFWRVHHLI